MAVVPVSRTTVICLVAILIVGCLLGVTAGAARQGLVARYYPTPEWTGDPVAAGLDDRVATAVLAARMGAGTSADFSARWQGCLRVDHPAEYQFTLDSNDVAWLSLDGRLRVNNGAYGSSHQTASVPLETGLYAVDLAFFSRGEDF